MDVLRTKIYQWYAIHQRELPWRKTKDPYKIWLSEIILQQTRVAQGMEYYRKFTDKYKTINDLANAAEDNVLKLWQGLGYYTRARNLHSTAKNIIKKYNGKFPEIYEEIIQLKGIGPYTASAILSIAFGFPYPAIDGNINRILSRYFGLSTPIDTAKGKKEIEKIAFELISPDDPGLHNQAFMDFGALQCVPKSPDCSKCPVSITCFANQKNMVEKFPVKTKKVKQRIRYFYYYLIESNEEILMEKRQEKDIWQNLYQIPLLESKYELQEDEFLAKRSIFNSNHTFILKNVLGVKKHILSHQIIYAKLIHLQTNRLEEISGQYNRVNKKDIYKFAVPKLLENFFNEIKLDE